MTDKTAETYLNNRYQELFNKAKWEINHSNIQKLSGMASIASGLSIVASGASVMTTPFGLTIAGLGLGGYIFRLIFDLIFTGDMKPIPFNNRSLVPLLASLDKQSDVNAFTEYSTEDHSGYAYLEPIEKAEYTLLTNWGYLFAQELDNIHPDTWEILWSTFITRFNELYGDTIVHQPLCIKHDSAAEAKIIHYVLTGHIEGISETQRMPHASYEVDASNQTINVQVEQNYAKNLSDYNTGQGMKIIENEVFPGLGNGIKPMSQSSSPQTVPVQSIDNIVESSHNNVNTSHEVPNEDKFTEPELILSDGTNVTLNNDTAWLVNFDYDTAFLWGQQGSGKSWTTRFIAARKACLGMKIVVLDPDSTGAEWKGVKGYFNPKDIANFIRSYITELESRIIHMQEHDMTEIEHEKWLKDSGKMMTVICEEVSTWKSTLSPYLDEEELETFFYYGLLRSRKQYMPLLIVTHNLTNSCLGGIKGLSNNVHSSTSIHCEVTIHPHTKKPCTSGYGFVKLHGGDTHKVKLPHQSKKINNFTVINESTSSSKGYTPDEVLKMIQINSQKQIDELRQEINQKQAEQQVAYQQAVEEKDNQFQQQQTVYQQAAKEKDNQIQELQDKIAFLNMQFKKQKQQAANKKAAEEKLKEIESWEPKKSKLNSTTTKFENANNTDSEINALFGEFNPTYVDTLSGLNGTNGHDTVSNVNQSKNDNDDIILKSNDSNYQNKFYEETKNLTDDEWDILNKYPHYSNCPISIKAWIDLIEYCINKQEKYHDGFTPHTIRSGVTIIKTEYNTATTRETLNWAVEKEYFFKIDGSDKYLLINII